MAQLLRSLTKDGNWIPIDISLTPNKTQTLRIHQTSHTRSWHWSIHEFSLWSRTSMCVSTLTVSRHAASQRLD